MNVIVRERRAIWKPGLVFASTSERVVVDSLRDRLRLPGRLHLLRQRRHALRRLEGFLGLLERLREQRLGGPSLQRGVHHALLQARESVLKRTSATLAASCPSPGVRGNSVTNQACRFAS